MTPTELRLRLLAAGYDPLPLFGKAPSMLKDWQHKTNTNDQEVEMWAKMWPDAVNTGVLTKYTPAFDIDILHPEAAAAVEEMVRDRFETGYCPVRTGKAPKRALLFHTDQPFEKITRVLIAPDGSDQRLKFLGNGQQLVVFGIHPDMRRDYAWHGGEPGEIIAEDLTYIIETDARRLIDDATTLLIEQFGFRERAAPKSNGAGEPSPNGNNWAHYLDNLIDHDALRNYANALLASGMHAGAVINHLRAQVEQLQVEDLERKQRSLGEIPGMVRSGAEKIAAKPEQQEAPADDWIWHGEVEPLDTRKYLVAGLLPETGACLISGQWGTYKTFVALDLAASVMTETAFINFPVRRRGGVLLIAAEGQTEVAVRFEAAFAAKGGTSRAPFAWRKNCPRLLDPNAAQSLTTLVKQAAAKMQQQFGLPVALVIIDTAGKAAGLRKDGQLNDDAAAKIIMKTLDDASHETGALFVGVAHFGKNVETGTKGSTGFEDDADVVLALLGERGINGIVENPRLCVRKRRSGPNGDEFPFRTEVMDMGTNADGYHETTLTLRWPEVSETDAARPKQEKDPWTAKSLRLLRQVLMNMLADCGQDMRPYPDGPVVRAVDQEIVRAEFYKSYPAEGDAEAKKAARQRAFRRAVLDAQAKGLIGVRDVGAITYVWLATPTTTQTSQTSARSNSSGSSGAHASPTCSSYEILGPASAGERCALCGKAGALRIKHAGGVDLWHEGCAKQYFAAMDDPPVKVPDPGPLDEHSAPMDTD